MQIISTLNSISQRFGLRYIVIGGHAVNIRGYGRTTNDLDIVTSHTDHEAWKEQILRLGYTLFHEQSGFMQFSVPDMGHWPLDVMKVKPDTFEKLWKEADELDFGGAKAKVAAALHLIPMKLYALKNGPKERWPKDIADILELLRLEKLDIEGGDFKQLCEKYGSMEIYDRIRQFKSP